MRLDALRSLVLVAFAAVVACGGKVLPTEPGPGPGIVPPPNEVVTDGTCDTSAPGCGVDSCGNAYVATCSSEIWSCLPPNSPTADDCIPPVQPVDAGYDVTTTSDAGVDTGPLYYPPDSSYVDSSAVIVCDTQSCPANMFCQEQSNFTWICADYPVECEGSQTCQCLLANGTSTCPQDFGWSCGSDSSGSLRWGCTAP